MTNMMEYAHKKKAVAAVIMGIISLVYLVIFGLIILVLIAFRTPIEALLYTFIVPVGLLSAGLAMSIYAKTKGGSRRLSVTGIIMNSIALVVVIAFVVLIILTQFVWI